MNRCCNVWQNFPRLSANPHGCSFASTIADSVETVLQVPKVYRALTRTACLRQVPAAAVIPPPNLTELLSV
jgi:hypothetical protein